MSPSKEGLSHERVLIHIHVPKCAGASINALMRDRFGIRAITNTSMPQYHIFVRHMTTEQRDADVDCIAGHFAYGTHELFTRPCVYFSVLRDPVARICSLFNYWHLRSSPPHSTFLAVNLPDLNAVSWDWLHQHIDVRMHFSNRACFFYSGRSATPVTFADIRRGVLSRLRERTFIVGPLGQIVDWLRAEGVLEPEQELPHGNRSAEYAAQHHFVPASPETLTEPVRKLLTRINRFDYQLIDAINEENAALGYEAARFAQVGA